MRTALVLSSYYYMQTVQVAKDTVVSKSDDVSVLVELMVYGCYIQKICGEH